jgi:hypothetical protein
MWGKKTSENTTWAFGKTFSGISDIIKHTMNERAKLDKLYERINSETKSEDNQDNQGIHPFSATKLFIEKIHSELPSDVVIMILDAFTDMEYINVSSADKDAMDRLYKKYIKVGSSDRDAMDKLCNKYKVPFPTGVFSKPKSEMNSFQKLTGQKLTLTFGTGTITYTFFSDKSSISSIYLLETDCLDEYIPVFQPIEPCSCSCSCHTAT